MSADKNWNKDEMLDIGSVGEDYIDPFGDDEFEQESRQYEEKKAAEAKPPKQEKAVQKAAPKQEKAVSNPLEAEIAAAEEKDAETARDGLFSKPPVFAFAGVVEEIEDTSITFEDLRIAKSEDFPELDDGKRVTWTVEYGKISKPISAPKKTEIAKCKSEIEASKEFLDALKKAKDKSPVCKLVPKVTAQSKGAMPQYKGVFSSFDAAERGGKMISLFPSGDGRVYEMRKTEMGRFITPVSETNAIQKVRAGFIPALPLIPAESLFYILRFFKYMAHMGSYEALANIYWDKQEEKFVIDIPEQTVTPTSVSGKISAEYSSDRYIHYVDIHSHNNMNAFFSKTDNRDEKAARVYAVVGKISGFFPEIKVRIANSRSFVEIDPSVVFESIVSVRNFPEQWKSAVLLEKEAKREKPDFWDALRGWDGEEV